MSGPLRQVNKRESNRRTHKMMHATAFPYIFDSRPRLPSSITNLGGRCERDEDRDRERERGKERERGRGRDHERKIDSLKDYHKILTASLDVRGDNRTNPPHCRLARLPRTGVRFPLGNRLARFFFSSSNFKNKLGALGDQQTLIILPLTI